MLNSYEPISTLVDGIKGVTSLMSVLLSRRTGLALILLALGAIASKLLFS